MWDTVRRGDYDGYIGAQLGGLVTSVDVICDGFVYFRLWPKSLVNFGALRTNRGVNPFFLTNSQVVAVVRHQILNNTSGCEEGMKDKGRPQSLVARRSGWDHG